MLVRAADGVPALDSAMVLRDYLEHWLDEVARPQVRQRTFETYESCVRRHILPTLGRKRLRALTPVDVRGLLNRKLDEGLSPPTVKYVHSVLRSALAQAVRDGLVQRNVATLVRPPRGPRKEAAYLDLDEARTLLDAAKDDRLHALWVVAISLGLRRELLGLRWSSVDLPGSMLRVRETVQRLRGEGLVIDETKSIRSNRTLPLPRMTADALIRHRARQDAERAATGARWRDHDLVFPSPIGTPMDPRNLNREFHALLLRSGVGLRTETGEDGEVRTVPRVRLHDLRHTCATFLVALGVPMRAIMEILGHSGIAITSDTYAHVVPSLLGDAAERMNDLLDPDDDPSAGDS
jgi:integrase